MRANNQNPNGEGGEAQGQEEEGEIDIRYKIGRDKPSDVRNVVLTVAVLLAAATYQAVLNPPGGIWQEDDPGTGRLAAGAPSPAATETTTQIKQVAGVSIFATKSKAGFILFMTGNTIGFLFSMGIIDDLTEGFTRKLELRIAVLAISFTYGMCVSIITPSEYRTLLTTSVFLITIAMVAVVRIRREKLCARSTPT